MHVCIIGAGPVGLLQCLHLLKVKDEMEANLKEGPVTISIFEGRGQQDLVDSSPNQRSINLALSWRGMKSLEAVGLLQQVLKDATPMAGRMIHPTTKESGPFAQAYSFHPNEVIYSVERVKLMQVLLKEVLVHCIKDGIKIYFRQKLLRLEVIATGSSILDFTSIKTIRADLVIGCDGSFSKVRTEMFKNFPGRVEMETFRHQYRELKIPFGSALSRRHLHIWPRNNFMLIALPNHDGGFTATLFSEMQDISNDNPIDFFREHFWDFLDAVGESKFLRDWQNGTANSLVSVRVDPIGVDGIILLGDAAHSILPFYGQGLNAGFEDVELFTDQLKNQLQISKSIAKYSASRIPDAKAIDELARDNYGEMRNRVLHRFYQWKHLCFLKLNEYFPELFGGIDK